eukprot:SAG11_NODE_2902_length_2849_cov_1.654909_2_plen_81_part_00
MMGTARNDGRPAGRSPRSNLKRQRAVRPFSPLNLRLAADQQAINYREEDFEEVVREATGGAGVDLILDMVRRTRDVCRSQ